MTDHLSWGADADEVERFVNRSWHEAERGNQDYMTITAFQMEILFREVMYQLSAVQQFLSSR